MLSVNVPTEAHPAVGHGQVWNICLSVGKVQIQTVKHNNRDCWFEKKHKQTPCCLQQFRHEYQEAVNLHKKMKRPSGAQQRAWRSGLQPTFAVMYRPYIWEATDMCWYVSTLSKKFTPSDKKKAETEEGGTYLQRCRVFPTARMQLARPCHRDEAKPWEHIWKNQHCVGDTKPRLTHSAHHNISIIVVLIPHTTA